MKIVKLFVLLSLALVASLTGCLYEKNYADPFSTGETGTAGNFFMLNIEADIPEVHIYVNGNFMGNKSVESHFISGTYKVEIKAAGYETYTEMVILNHSWTIRAQMKKLSGLEDEVFIEETE